MAKIYTRHGDDGMTSLIGGVKVKKTHPRIEAYGTVDELSAQLGKLASYMKDGDNKSLIVRTQRNLFTLCSYLATDKAQTEVARSFTLDEEEIRVLEEQIDYL
ncbi:MAG: ATP:cob(I)alamin adenosyltransferase, partial [Prevotella sp.]|nr:ATP:cob(I)alamin adenosyltransferase [Prevotella sp.]